MTHKELSDLICDLKVDIQILKQNYELDQSKKNLEALQDAEDYLVGALDIKAHL